MGRYCYKKIADRAREEGLMTTPQMAAHCGVSMGAWRGMMDNAVIPRADVFVDWSVRPLYKEEDAEYLRQCIIDYQESVALERSDYWRLERERRRMYSQQQASSALKVPHVTFVSWLNKGWLPRPTHRVGCLLCYDETDLERMREWCRNHYQPRVPYNG